MKLLLIRHGETAVNASGRMHGVDDPAVLTAAGRAQAEQAARVCAEHRIEALWSSPEPRAVETARIISVQTEIPVEVRPELAERNWGDWSDLTWPEIEPKLRPLSLPERYTFRPPHGETWAEMDRRLTSVLDALNDRPYRAVAIVTHMGALRALIPVIDHLPKEDSLTLEFVNGEVVIRDVDR